MKVEKNKRLYWVFKIVSVAISCFFPISAIFAKFPLWTETHGAGRSLGVGMILTIIVVLIVFRKSVFSYIKKKLKLKHAPPLAVWLVLLVISYVFVYMADFMRDLNTVLWMGLIGCTIGNVLTFIAEHFYGKKGEE